jgi:hypothetical protein
MSNDPTATQDVVIVQGGNKALVSSAGSLQVTASLLNGGPGIAGNQSAIAVFTEEVAPTAANILTGTSSTDAGTIITVPANRIWKGSLTLSGTVTVAAGANAAVTANPNVTVTGATATPAATTIVNQLMIDVAANLAGGTNGSSACDTATVPNLVIVAGTSAATLQLHTGSASHASATAAGYLQ